MTKLAGWGWVCNHPDTAFPGDRVRRNLLSIGSLLCLLTVVVPARAESGARGDGPADAVRIQAWPQGYADLRQGWRFHLGDDPAWAQPNYDDSAWPVVSLNDPRVKGLGYRWLRLRVHLEPGLDTRSEWGKGETYLLAGPYDSGANDAPGPLVLGVVGFRGAYQLYVNGQPAGAVGFLPAVEVGNPFLQTVPLPSGAADVEIALRLKTPAYLVATAGPLPTAAVVTVGTPGAVAAAYRQVRDEPLLENLLSLAVDGLLMLGGIAVLALFFGQRSHREYLWLGLLLMVLGASDFALAGTLAGILPASTNALFGDPTDYLIIALQIEFTFAFVARRITRPWRAYEFLLVGSTLAAIPLNWMGIPSTPYLSYEMAATTPGAILLPIFLFVWYRRGNREAGWLVIPSLFGLSGALFNLGYIAAMFHWNGLLILFNTPMVGGVGIRPIGVADFVFLLAIALVIFLRFARVSRAEARAAAELEAAREIQQTLVPAELPEIEGCRMAAAYLPAAQVGGDFYQVLRQLDGSTLVAVGDVSGKGLKAAMTGTLAIGALRTLAAEARGPAALLEGLNREMLGAQQGGFITMICARIAAGGEVTLANAGHLHPYRNGEEVVLDSALPLGTAAGAVYREEQVLLAPGDTLTFLSDGVVEARDAAGELFGFERTAAVATQAAAEIARAAQRFGQQDDITVLTVTFAPAEVAA